MLKKGTSDGRLTLADDEAAGVVAAVRAQVVEERADAAAEVRLPRRLHLQREAVRLAA